MPGEFIRSNSGGKRVSPFPGTRPVPRPQFYQWTNYHIRVKQNDNS